MFFLALNVGQDLRWIRLATWLVIWTSVAAIVGFYLQINIIERVLNIGGLFTLWVVSLSYGQALFNEELPRSYRFGLVVLVVAWLFRAMIVQTSWFSGWIPALVAVLVLTLWRSRRVFVAMVLSGGLVVAANWPQVHQALWENKVSQGDLTRVDIWAQAWDLFGQHPFIGVGPAGYAPYYVNLYSTSAFSMSTHSNYVDVLLETGIIGTVVFAWFFLTLLVIGWRACHSWRLGFASGYSRGAFAALLGLLVAMGLGDWFIPFIYNQTIAGYRYTVHSWVFLGFLASLATFSQVRGQTTWMSRSSSSVGTPEIS
jgi:O-antigen ligase